MTRSQVACGLLCLVLASPAAVAGGNNAPSHDWPTWRGPNRDAKSTETGLLDHWGPKGPPIQWQIHTLGSGFSSVTISNGRIFTMGKRSGQAELIALDEKDGKELWATPVGGGDPNGSPTVDGDLVFAIGFDGDLVCAQTDSGQLVWKKNFKQDFGGRMMSHWGYSESPLVDGNKLLCTPGANDAMIVALDKRTGTTIWKAAQPASIGPNGKDGAGYSSIVISEGAGVRQYVQNTGRGLISVAADDGRFLWSYNRIANGTANIPTPVVSGDYVFGSNSYDSGSALVKLSPDKGGVRAEEVYFLNGKTMQNHHGGLVLVGDHIYCGHGKREGFPLCIEMKTGREAWRPGRGPGSNSAAVLYADGHLYFRYQDGVMALIEANPNKYVLKGTFKQASQSGSETWPHPVISDGRLYLRDQQTLLCYDIAKK